MKLLIFVVLAFSFNTAHAETDQSNDSGLECLLTYFGQNSEAQEQMPIVKDQTVKAIGSYSVTTFIDVDGKIWVAIIANGVKTMVSGSQTEHLTASVSLENEELGVVCGKSVVRVVAHK